MSSEVFMGNSEATFGRHAAQAATPAAFLEFEARAGHSDQFSIIDGLVETLLRRSLNGEQVAVLTNDNWVFTIAIPGLHSDHKAFLGQEFMLDAQQRRGAWFLSEAVTLDVGWANFPFHFQHQPSFATGIMTEDRGKVRLHGSANAVFFWSVVEPLFEKLYYPFALRGPLAGAKDRDWQRNAWHEAEAFLNALNFDVREALAPIRYGGGWSKLRAQEQIQAKQALLQALRNEARHPHAAHYRAYQVQRLVARYYRQAKKDPPKMRQVVTKDVQPVLAGFFGGDWLAFLTYIGEEPHPDERIATALPEPRLLGADRDRVTQVAAAQGLPAMEVERALAAFWGADTASSPIEERVEVLRAYWSELDVIHARQRPGMTPLWGLVDDGGISLTAREPYHPGLYRQLLTSGLLASIERLWGACMLTAWPDRLVSTISPHALVAEAFGPALKFWHGCALTAWFVCEGPYSRTDVPGLAAYYAREIAALAQLGVPVDSALFEELRHAETQLGLPQRIADPDHTTRHDVGDISFTLEFSTGTRRDGFELLRDIITRYRRSWSERYLEAYLRSRWETEIRDAARDFSLLYERKGRAPNPKQFAPHAVQATNHWFGGDMSSLYRMIGEKSPVEVQRHHAMPNDREAFVRSVHERLSTVAHVPVPSASGGGSRDNYQHSEEHLRRSLEWMAEASLRYIQREEALGRALTLDEFGRDGFVYRASVLSPDIENAWSTYQRAIALAQRSPVMPHGQQESQASTPSQPERRKQDFSATVDAQSERKPF
jgi:hypothetical protein